MELKNQLTGQYLRDAEKQYMHDRKPEGEPLFKFKRCLVHFCVDNDRVSMTTRLNGNATRFLPYNRDIENPDIEGDYRTAYLWNEILVPDSVLDIIENFVLVAEETSKKWDPKKGKVVAKKDPILIFPRYHQLQVIRKLRDAVKDEGVGRYYLVQHTTGSGKSYSIGWLAHTLTSLYRSKEDTTRMFDTILVLTDRRVLDKQLQHTVGSLEQTQGVVNKVDVNSAQLQEYLEKGKDIIITTVQKFPVISEKIAQLKSKSFAVIIDEVHSSQSGETSKHLKKSLSKLNVETDEEGNIDYEDLIRKDIESRGKQDHISFFGFTGTPKGKTLELFGRMNSEGEYEAFHNYTMRQSIAEGFTLDVLKNYTSYKRYFKVLQKSEQDQEVPESQVKRELVRYVDSHPETIKQKVAIILDHFVHSASREIDGKARAMVVVRSRKHCVLFQEEMVKQMRERHLTYSCLVAFSGSIHHNGIDNTETSLNTANGLTGTNIPDGLKDPKFRILIVSSKYQTGFDEPLLQSMYIDKMMSGVQCVQTLSRLNRTAKGKQDTFILDFVNETEDIVESFKPYYTTTVLSEGTDPDKIYEMLYQIEEFNVYNKHQLDEFARIFYDPTSEDRDLQNVINTSVDRYKEDLTEEEQDDFKSQIQKFIRTYSYISQIISFAEVDWEKAYIFLRFLNKKLPREERDRIFVDEDVDLDSLRIQMIGKTSLKLENEVGELDPTYAGDGSGKPQDQMELLSQIIEKLNSVYGVDLGEEDKVTLEQIERRVRDDDRLQKVLTGKNTEDVKYEYFRDFMKDIMTDYYGDRMEFYKKMMDERVFPMLVKGMYEGVVRNSRNS
jgi:type I restriction enzyme R subunit